MATYAALVSLINNIQQITSHPHLSSSLHIKHTQTLQEKVGFLLDFTEANNHGNGSKEDEDLEREIARAAHAAEDVIESHIVDQIHAGTSEEASFRCPLDLHTIIQAMDAVMEKATEVKAKHGFREEQPAPSRAPVKTGETTATVGLDAELIQLLHELTGHQSSRHIISIVGMGGMGKTTLARSAYENILIKQHFDIRVWATVSQQCNMKEILLQLLPGQVKFTNETADALGARLHKTLFCRRYLIILDDLWSAEDWDEVKHFFPDNGNRSRIVITTRLSYLAVYCDSSYFKMNLLDEDKSWKLFCEKAFQNEDCPPQLEEVGKKIVKLCKGLPLSIVVIGGLLLKSPRVVEHWENVARDIKSIPNSKEKQQSLDALSLSYNHLPPHLKPCFLYMGAFKEDSCIRVSKIIKLWIAEGFIKPNATQTLEDIAEGYLNDLVDRNLILVRRRRCNGKIRFCGIHDLLRDLCLKVAEQEEFLHVSEEGIRGRRGTERRLVFSSFVQRFESPLARSIMLENRVGQQIKHRLLRVLHGACDDSLQVLFENVNLRYLVYEHPHIYFADLSVREIPSSISLLWNLQTLIIRGARSAIVVAPIEIWKVRHLRHLQCHQIYVPDPPPSGHDELLILEKLHTLKSTVNFKLSEEVCEIIPNIKKLRMVYDGDLQGYNELLVESVCNLDRLHKLESLNMSIKRSMKEARVCELNEILRFPSLLNKLSLSECQLKWDDLRMIGSLPHLEVLNLEMNSVMVGEEWSPVCGQFRSLKVLRIVYCDLVNWYADHSHFPVLEKLVLRFLVLLVEIPWGIGEIPTLEHVCVDRCSESAAVSAVKIKEDELKSQGNDGCLQIRVRMFDSELESFKEMVETEGLSINNIQLEILP